MSDSHHGDEIVSVVLGMLDGPVPPAVVVVGEPGSGRSTTARRIALALGRTRRVRRIDPAGTRTAFSALADVLPGLEGTSLAPAWVVPDAVRALEHALDAGCPGLALVVDDADRVDQASMAVVAEAARSGAAVVLTRAERVPPPDPTDWVRPVRVVHLSGLDRVTVGSLLGRAAGTEVHPSTVQVVHAVTAGNPGRVHRLIAGTGLVDQLTLGTPARITDQPAPVATGPAAAGFAVGAVDAVDRAWAALDLDGVEEAGRFAMLVGAGARVAAIRIMAATLAGRLDRADRIGSDHASDTDTRIELAHAFALGLGHGRVEAARETLARAAARSPQAALLQAHRAWLGALIGIPPVPELDAAVTGDREAATMIRLAHGVLALDRGDGPGAMAHLRVARVRVQGLPPLRPWAAPYLDACLLDAALLAGRRHEAAAMAAVFHRGVPGSGWDAAAAIAVLCGRRGTPAETAGRTERGGLAEPAPARREPRVLPAPRSAAPGPVSACRRGAVLPASAVPSER